MIPLRLRLKNFLGYRDAQELSLEGVHLACLSGDNGAGKSALLDAMTWALWGQARGKSADDVVHLGQSETEVEMEFGVDRESLGDERHRYRVLRKHRRGAPGRPSQTILEFQVASNGNTAAWQPLTGNGVRETQHKIINVLGLDYETFINSAFLLQGRADAFTVKKASERKELLAEILGLSFYDELERRAKEKCKESEAQVRLLDSELENIARELALKGAYEGELKEAREAILSMVPRLRSQEDMISSLRQKQGELDAKREELGGLLLQIGQAEKDVEALRSREGERQRLIHGYEALLGQREDIEANYNRLLEARKDAELWNQKAMALNPLQREESRLELAIKDTRNALEKEQALLEKYAAELEAKALTLPQTRQSLTQGQAWLAESMAREEALRQKRDTAQERRETVSSLQLTCKQIEGELASLNEKIGLLARADAHCPLCEAELGTEGKRLLDLKYRNEMRAKSEARAAALKDIDRYQKEYQVLTKEADDGQAKLGREREAAHRRMAVLERQLSEAEAAETAVAAEKDKLASLERRLAQDVAPDLQAQLARTREQIMALAYDYAKHQAVRKVVEGILPAEDKKRQLNEAEIRIQSEQQALSHIQEAFAQTAARRQELQQKKQDLEGELVSAPEVARALREADEARRKLMAEERAYRDRIAAAQSQLDRCQAREQEKAQKEELRLRSGNQEAIYRDLAEAFGKKGVPALLIEAALPELEVEANRLLGRMTENRLSVKLESQREHRTGKGDPIETLDIKISDDLGTRDYEMFSGGEAFRINFALRIALSKLLARRAGAPLPTLVIDEGFGTQDSSGREKLVDAINSVQADFERILVITHIEELKDLFPVRIEVTKTSEGSTFRVT